MSDTEVDTRPSYAELEAFAAQVAAFAALPPGRGEDGFGRGFVAGDASARRGLAAICKQFGI